ncbi:DMT family transporter [Variovorax sp. J22P168]|uniref:DMT family transporter n=1 Tax=Variovorax jilinensis TaxID=3053513 RepID=UPI00257759D4|nr:DMT family transporter [Variovorax sp. J22P168]MDM0011228.1 DMT family transporter [Variovorax sp. J22P168]
MTPAARAARAPDLNAGIALVLLTACMFAGSDATIKYLGGALPVLVLMWVRYMFQTSVLAAWQLARKGTLRLRSRAPALQCLRGLLLLCNSTAAFYGVQRLPLAEYTALSLLAPVATTVLGALVLKERVPPSRWAMVGFGVVGMLAVVRPTGAGALGWAALLPITGALCYAAFQLVTRRIAIADDLVVTNFLSALFVTTAIGAALWVLPLDLAPSLLKATPTQWVLLLLIGIFATAGHLCMAGAVRLAPLSVLMPFAYAQIAFAMAIGWLLFDHAPDLWAVVGTLLIGLGGIGTVWLNGRDAGRMPA